MNTFRELSMKYPNFGICLLINLGIISYSWFWFFISMIWNKFNLQKSLETHLFIWGCHLKIIASLFIFWTIFIIFSIILFAMISIFDRIKGE